MTIRLELADPTGAVRTFTFDRGPVNVGRARNADVHVEGEAVSRVHAVLQELGGAWSITHRGSALPTLLNGNVLTPGNPVQVNDGDVAEIAGTRIGFHVISDMDSAPPTFLGGPTLLPDEPMESAPPPFVAPGPSGQDVPTLLATTPTGAELRLELREPGRDYTVGRADVCDLTVDDGSMSRRHAILRTDGARVFVRDAGARNPVRVNGRPIVGETPIEPGDQLQMGSTEIRYIATGWSAAPARGAAPAEPPPPPFAAPPPRSPPPPSPPPPAPAPAGAGGWDALVGGPAQEPPVWTPADHTQESAPPPRPVAPPPPAPAADGGGWAAKVRQAPGERAPERPAWDVPDAAPQAQAPPPKLSWHDEGGPGAGGGPAWDGPPPVAPPGAAPPPPPLRPAAPPPMAPPPASPAPQPPPPPVVAEEPDLGTEPKVVTRRGSSQKGWLVAGAIFMFLAVALGLVFVMIAISTQTAAEAAAGAPV